MRYIAAYLLTVLAGKTADAETITNTLTASGVEVDAAKVAAVLKELEGKDLDEVIASGKAKFATVGGAASGPSGSASGAAAAEEEPEEEEEEESEGGFGGLFD